MVRFSPALSALYNDDNWQVFDPDNGDIYYTATLEVCEGAARSDVEEQYQNHCVQCLLDYVDENLAVTYSFPVAPVAADDAGDIRMTGAGLAFNGIRIDGPAPVEGLYSRDL